MERNVSRPGAERLPADHGLAALGLIMQLGGAIFLVWMAMEVATCVWERFVHTAVHYHDWYSRSDDTRVAFLVIAASGVLRSALHVRAGRALARPEPLRRAGPGYAYIAFAVVQTALALRLINACALVTAKVYLTVGLLLLAWPLVLLVVLGRRRLRCLAMRDASLAREEPGTNDAPTLMVVLGAIGSLTALLLLYTALSTWTEPTTRASVQWLLMVHVCALLMARSLLHALAGVAGLRDGGAGGGPPALARYTTFGVVSALAIGGLLLAVQWLGDWQYSFHSKPFRVMGMVGLLLAWPLVLRRLHGRRSTSHVVSGAESSGDRVAPDGGMTALGWLLLAIALFQLAFAVPEMFYGREGLGSSLPWQMAPVTELLQVAATNPRVPWWSAGVSLLQISAAISLIRSTERCRMAATLYGAVSTAVTIWLLWPQMFELDGVVGSGLHFGFPVVVQLLNISCWLVVPLVTLILASRMPSSRQARRSR